MARRFVQRARRRTTWVTADQQDAWDNTGVANVPEQTTLLAAGSAAVPTGSTLLRLVGQIGVITLSTTGTLACGFAGIYFDTHGALTLDPASSADMSTGAWLWWKSFPAYALDLDAGTQGTTIYDFDIRVKRKLDDAENEIQIVSNMPVAAAGWAFIHNVRALIMLP